jgi:formamidopyrimidine-DNA glycosylase
MYSMGGRNTNPSLISVVIITQEGSKNPYCMLQYRYISTRIYLCMYILYAYKIQQENGIFDSLFLRQRLINDHHQHHRTMVEGPGATRNATKARTLVGWTYDNELLVEALSVGKEVFLVFENKALRLHFGMNGSLLVQGGRGSGANRRHHQGTPSFSLTFRNGKSEERSVECVSTTINTVTPFVARSKYERLHQRDVCTASSQFDSTSVLEALLQRPESMLADVLLDQARFPGVGNIIKIEALHQAKLHPKKLVSSCTEPELLLLIQHCRDYAMKWLHRGRAPDKRVYNRTICQTCQAQTVCIEKMGNDLSRTTFWCNICQPSSGSTPSQRSPLEVIATNSKPQELPPSILKCPQHGEKPVRLRRVRKSNSNHGRLFVSCPSCQFFAWADQHLQRSCCKNREQCVLKISKTSRTGGKWFVSCKGCEHFAWATAKDLKPFGTKLTPLL